MHEKSAETVKSNARSPKLCVVLHKKQFSGWSPSRIVSVLQTDLQEELLHKKQFSG